MPKKHQQNLKTDQWIRASDIGAATFCPYSVYLKKILPEKNPHLIKGQIAHKKVFYGYNIILFIRQIIHKMKS